MAIAGAAAEGLAGAAEGGGGGLMGAAQAGKMAELGVRIRGDFKNFNKGLMDMSKQSQQKGKEAAKGFEGLMKQINVLKQSSLFQAFNQALNMVVSGINFLIDHSTVLQTVLGALNDVFGGMIDIFLAAFLPAIMPIVSAFAQLIPVVAQTAQQFQPLAQELGAKLIQFFKDNKDAIDKVISGIVDLIGTGLITFLQVVIELLPVLNPLIKMMGDLFKEAVPVIKIIVEVLAAIGATGIVAILGLILAAINVLLAPLAALKIAWDVITGAIGTLVGWIKQFINWLGQAGSAIANSPIGQFFSGAANVIGGGISSISGFFSSLGLAQGGLVTSPTLAMVGEAGPELVIPMSKMGQLASSATNSSTSSINIQINVPNVHIGSPDPKTIRQFTDMVEMEMRKRINMGLVSTLR